jgi:hypothetical protein
VRFADHRREFLDLVCPLIMVYTNYMARVRRHSGILIMGLGNVRGGAGGDGSTAVPTEAEVP